jgi:hypothetical protein
VLPPVYRPGSKPSGEASEQYTNVFALATPLITVAANNAAANVVFLNIKVSLIFVSKPL